MCIRNIVQACFVPPPIAIRVQPFWWQEKKSYIKGKLLHKFERIIKNRYKGTGKGNQTGFAYLTGIIRVDKNTTKSFCFASGAQVKGILSSFPSRSPLKLAKRQGTHSQSPLNRKLQGQTAVQHSQNIQVLQQKSLDSEAANKIWNSGGDVLC